VLPLEDFMACIPKVFVKKRRVKNEKNKDKKYILARYLVCR
jgi:hypothetical protein